LTIKIVKGLLVVNRKVQQLKLLCAANRAPLAEPRPLVPPGMRTLDPLAITPVISGLRNRLVIAAPIIGGHAFLLIGRCVRPSR